jgi:hypothetical protein
VAQYQLVTPWENQTWLADNGWAYSRLAGRRLAGGTITGSIPVSITDVPRGVSLLVTGSAVTATMTPYQDDLANADAAYLGGHEYVLDQAAADVLIAAGYGDYLTLIED